MSSKDKAKDRPRMISVKPSAIKIPDVRVTSSWDPELLGMFRDSIKAMGIVEPIVAVEEKGELWLVDGLHRLEEAQLQNLPRVQAVAIPGSLRDVYLKNLMLNRLRGKTKTSEMVMVIKKLEEEFKMDMDTIARATGLKRDYVEKMLVIGRVRPEVLRDLDAERIHVGHAYEIGRVEDPDVQLRLLLQVKQYDLNVADLHDVVESTLQILQERKNKPDQPPGPMTIPPATIKCHFCDLERPVREVRGFNLCQTCFAIGYETVQQRKAASGLPPTEQKEDEE